MRFPWDSNGKIHLYWISEEGRAVTLWNEDKTVLCRAAVTSK